MYTKTKGTKITGTKTVQSKRTEIQSTSKQEKNIFGYSPFKDNDVLHVIYTVYNIIMLLKNGTCVSWGLNRMTLGRRCTEANVDSYIPMAIKFPTKIVDIACGRNHVLTRGANFKVYSWGSNSHGQLGLSGFPVNSNSDKDEPSEIQTFQTINIKQIFASGNTSFAITEGGNNVYGWGDNKNGQIGMNFERGLFYQIPKLIDVTEKLTKEAIIYQNKNGLKSFIAELQRPASDVSQAMVFFDNKNLHYKEVELRDEYHKLEIQEEQLKKRRRNTNKGDHQDNDQLLFEIENMIFYFTDKLNKANLKAQQDESMKNVEITKSYGLQMDYQKEKELTTNKKLKTLEKMENALDVEKHKNRTTIGEENAYLLKKTATRNEKEKIIKIEQIIETVNSGLHKNRAITLAENEVLKEKIKKVQQKMGRLSDSIEVFRYVKKEAGKILSKSLDQEKIKDLKGIMEKLVEDQETLSVNNKFN